MPPRPSVFSSVDGLERRRSDQMARSLSEARAPGRVRRRRRVRPSPLHPPPRWFFCPSQVSFTFTCRIPGPPLRERRCVGVRVVYSYFDVVTWKNIKDPKQKRCV